MVLELKDKLACPHCKKEESDLAEDYVLPSNFGRPISKFQCGYCDEWFTAQRTEDNKIKVIPIKSS